MNKKKSSLPTHLMIDLETLSTETDKPVVIEGGLVVFNRDKIIYKENMLIDIESQIGKGGKIDGDTLSWWFKDKKRREYLLQKLDLRKQLTDAEYILMFLDKINSLVCLYDVKFVWANSPTFDLAILRSWCKDNTMDPPWGYREERDFRTLNKEFFETGIINKPNFSNIKYTHNALDDAIFQTKYVQEFLKWSGNIQLKQQMKAYEIAQQHIKNIC